MLAKVSASGMTGQRSAPRVLAEFCAVATAPVIFVTCAGVKPAFARLLGVS